MTVILPYDIIGYINSFLARPVHRTAKLMKELINLYNYASYKLKEKAHEEMYQNIIINNDQLYKWRFTKFDALNYDFKNLDNNDRLEIMCIFQNHYYIIYNYLFSHA